MHCLTCLHPLAGQDDAAGKAEAAQEGQAKAADASLFINREGSPSQPSSPVLLELQWSTLS